MSCLKESISNETYSGTIVDVVGNRIFKGEVCVKDGKILSVKEKEFQLTNLFVEN
jgi:adenine deaminase